MCGDVITIKERVKEGSSCPSKRGKTLIKTDSVDKATTQMYACNQSPNGCKCTDIDDSLYKLIGSGRTHVSPNQGDTMIG